MIIRPDGSMLSPLSDEANLHELTIGPVSVCWKGLLLMKGIQRQEAIAKEVIEEYKRSQSFPFDLIRGHFFLFLADEQRGTRYLFTDNSGGMQIFMGKETVASSFLELSLHLGLTVDDLDAFALTELMHFGFAYEGRSLFASIRKLDVDHFLKWQDGRLEVISKGISGIRDPGPALCFEDAFADLASSLRGYQVSVDLTGGADSRLICCLLHAYGLDFETAISGVAGNRDIEIAQVVSSLLGKKLRVLYHDDSDLDEGLLDSILQLTDGQTDILQYHRNYQLNKMRQEAGIEVALSGVGGELYKDFWWLQDFPFYNRRKSNIRKLYAMRIESLSFPHRVFGEEYRAESEGLGDRTVQALEQYWLDTNTQTYDNIYYNYKMRTNAGTYLSATANWFSSYAPLLERDLVRLGFQLPRRQRFFNNFHRRTISRHCMEIARVRTTENTNVSNRTNDVFRDVLRYGLDKQRRLMKQVMRKLLNKTYFQQNPTNQKVYDRINEQGILCRAVDTLQEVGILANTLTAEQIPIRLVGRILTLSKILQEVAA